MTKELFVVLGAAAAAAAQQIGSVEIRTDESGHRAIAVVDTGDRPAGGTGLNVRGEGWVPLGPFGGDVQDVNVSPVNASIALAGVAPAGGSGGTLFRSTDGGQTWTEVAQLTGTSVYDVEFDPSGNAYIGTFDGVWKSMDGGATWTAQDLGIGLNDQVFDVAIDPNNANNIWAGVADAIGSQPNNIMRSTNGGAMWFNATPPLASPQSGRSIAVNPSNSDVVVTAFAGAFGGGQVWVSPDGGLTWNDRSFGLPNNPINAVVHTGTRILLAGGQAFGSQFVGLYESTNDGVTWTPLHDGTWPALLSTSVAVDPNNASILFATTNTGVHRSDNGGATWQIAAGGTDGLSLNSVRFAPGSSMNILIGANSLAVLRSTDAGVLFAQSAAGIGALNAYGVEADPNDNNNVALAFQGLNDGGLFTSTDAGQTWTLESAPGTRWEMARFAPDGTLYAISDGPTTIAPEGLYRREANGTWTSIGPDQGTRFESELRTARFSESDPNLIVLGGNDFGVAGFDLTIWRSTNAGANWTKVLETFSDDRRSVEGLRIVADGTDQTIVAGFTDFSTPQEGGVLRTTDGGQMWVESSTGLPFEAQPMALCPSPANPNTLFLADGDVPIGGVHVSTDAGQTWSNTGFTERVLDVECDADDPQVLYVLQSVAPKVQRSEDGGATFQPFDTGLAAAGFSRDLFYAPGTPARLYMGSATGAYRRDLAVPCPADLNGDGIVDVFDLLDYLVDWFAGAPAADIDGVAGVDVFDLLAFLERWFAGC